MKKVILGVTTALLTVILCLAFVGCTTKVKGKTYAYDKYETTYTDDASDIVKGACDAAVATFALGLKNSKLEFKDDGKVNMGGSVSYDYKQDGKTVTVKNGEFEMGKYTVDGKNLKATLSAEDMGLTSVAGLKSITVIYKQA